MAVESTYGEKENEVQFVNYIGRQCMWQHGVYPIERSSTEMILRGPSLSLCTLVIVRSQLKQE